MKKIILLIMLLLTSMLFANTYTVIQNGNGDFTTIQAAVNYVSPGDEILVFDGIYYEDITINTHSITLKSVFGSEDCIIDGIVRCITVNYPMDRIEGFTFKDASNCAIYLEYGVDELINCIFEDNESVSGGYIPNASAIMSGLPIGELSGCIFKDNEGDYTVSLYGDYYNNPVEYETVKNNQFINNTNTEKDISIFNVSSNYHGIIENNTFIGSSGGIYVHQIMLYGNADINIRNCVFDDAGIYDDNNYNASNKIIISYCSFTNSGYQNTYNWGNGNLTTTDPELNSTTYQPLWDSITKSPCIDTGDPALPLNPDGTPTDIGAVRAITHKYDIVEFPSPSVNNGWKWLSFPALDDVLNNADIAGNVLETIIAPPMPADLDKVYAQNYTIFFDDPNWQHIDEQFLRTEGYKFHMNDDAVLDVPGFLEDPTTQISLVGNQVENWIGYFLEDSHDVEDAFAEIWDDLYFIWTQHWGMIKLQGVWFYHHPEDAVLEYGDMVIVKCDNPHNFRWCNSGPIKTKETIPKPDYFSYTEKADYIPIYLEFDPDDIPVEVGVFVDGECKGAAVVEGAETQICTYLDDGQQGEIEFEFYYGNRDENKKIDSYNCLTSNNLDRVMKQLSTHDKADAWLVSFREESNVVPAPEKVTLSNYPNPFNPSTTISYSLPLEGDVSLCIYNVRGQLVKQLINGSQLEGYYEVVWNGKDNTGRSVASGIYYYQIKACGKNINKKMLMLK